MKMHRGDGKSLKGSNKCSVWHRHTFMSPHVTMQPEGLRQNDGVFHIVAYPGRCRWATSVAALQAAFDGGRTAYPGRYPGLHLFQPAGWLPLLCNLKIKQ